MDDQTARELIQTRIRDSVKTKIQLLENVDTIHKVARVMVAAYENHGKVLLFGNGGSAADAQHIAGELVGIFYIRNRAPLPMLALTTNTSSLTAIANDLSFAEVFARQVEAYGAPGDVAIGISTSGNSDNVNRALEVAKQKGMIAVGLTGRTGGRSGEIVDYCITVPSDETPRIQEAHILIGHILCELVEREIFGQQSDALYASDASERDVPVVVTS
ncbi:MAG: D-sedoheptulose 7-phosphate isomerase [Chloroflexi bacterium]|nr:D-sedoheptulose 7-phosphate isomerase [Chloroflexota bacterium]